MIKFEKIPADIFSRIPAAKESLAQDSRIIFAYLFGGLAKGEVRPLTDVDIAVYLNSTEDLAEYRLELFSRLSDALGTSEFDLWILNTATESLLGRILQNKEILRTDGGQLVTRNL